jgi:hypothetical protein
VVEVGDGEPEPVVAPEPPEAIKEAHGIRPPGDCDQHVIPWGKQSPAPHFLPHPLKNAHTFPMVAGKIVKARHFVGGVDGALFSAL